MIPTKDESLPLPPIQPVEAPPPTISIQTPTTAPNRSTLDKVTNAAGTIANSMQQGLSYANARRAREAYRG